MAIHINRFHEEIEQVALLPEAQDREERHLSLTNDIAYSSAKTLGDLAVFKNMSSGEMMSLFEDLNSYLSDDYGEDEGFGAHNAYTTIMEINRIVGMARIAQGIKRVEERRRFI